MEFFNRLLEAVLVHHPWHVPLVHFPIALSAIALLFLVLALWRRNDTLEKAAFYNLALIPISTVVAGLTGYRDHLVRFEGDTPYSEVKIFLSITLFILTVGLTISRWRQPTMLWNPKTMVVYSLGFLITFGLTSMLGFLGGVIIYGF